MPILTSFGLGIKSLRSFARKIFSGISDPTFATYDTQNGADNTVAAIDIQSDGKIVVGGFFNTFNGVITKITRLNEDGSTDNNFTDSLGAGPNNSILSIKIQSDGKIIAGGFFTSWNGTAVNRIVRLNSDGTRDTDFSTNVGTGANNSVDTIAIQSDGKIILGGSFTSWNGTAVNRIVRLNSDGTRDTDFSTNLETPSSLIRTIKIQSDGKILVGGDFTLWGSTTVNRIVRLNSNGTRDTAFSTNTGTAADSRVWTIETQSDGKIIVAGEFFTWNNEQIFRIVRLNSDGTRDTNFSLPLAPNNSIRSVAVQSDGKIYIGGFFDRIGTNVRSRISRLTSNGSLDPSFPVTPGASASVRDIKIQSDGKILAGGDFTTWDISFTNRLVRVNSVNEIDNQFIFSSAANAEVYAVGVTSDGKILAGGIFSSWNNTPTNRFVALDSSGEIDTSFMTNIGSGPNSSVDVIKFQTDGKILIGGSFTSINNISIGRGCARLNLDGSVDNTFTLDSAVGANNNSNDFAIQSDGKIVVVGPFTSWTFTTVNRIVRLNSNGTRDTAFSTNTGTAANNSITSIKIQSDGKIIAGGFFTSWNGTAVNRIVRLNSDGTRDTDFSTNVGTGANNSVDTIAIQSDGKIILGGSFTSWNGTAVNRIVRLNSDGTRDTNFSVDTIMTYCRKIVYQSDGKFLVGGNKSGQIRSLYRFNSNGSLDAEFFTNAGEGPSGGFSRVQDIAIQSDGKIIVGGEFFSYNNTNRSNIVRLEG